MDDALPGREVIFEIYPIGLYKKVTAVDVATMTEIFIQGPANAPEELLKRNALKRLEFVMRKKGLIA